MIPIVIHYKHKKLKLYQILYLTSNKTMKQCKIEANMLSLNIKKSVIEKIKKTLKYKQSKKIICQI